MTRPHLVDQDVPGPRRDVVGYGRHQPRVRWPNGAKVAVNIVVNNEEGSEYSMAQLGEWGTRGNSVCELHGGGTCVIQLCDRHRKEGSRTHREALVC
jgi:hypothetical protein